MIARRRPLSRGSFRMNGRGWVYLALAASVAFAAAIKGNNLLFAIFCILIAQFLVSGILTIVVARGIEVSRVLPASAVAGEVFPLGIRLRNLKRFWPAFCLRIEDRIESPGRASALPPTPVWIPMAGARKRVRTTSYATVPERGWARLGPFTIVSEFPPGLFEYRRIVPVVNRLLIYPRLAVLSRRLLDPLLARADYSDLSTHHFDRGQEEFAGLREYRDGDSPRDIHWKMSSRLPGRLLVREHEDPLVKDAVLYLETFIPKAAEGRRRGRLERAVRFGATLADALLSQGYRIRLRAFAPEAIDVELDPRARDIDRLLHELAILRPTRIHPLTELLSVGNPPGDAALFILRIADDPLPARDGFQEAILLSPSELRTLMEEPELPESGVE
ncbi:MAG TPA: DUF58 domain-containing protein [Planctomycetota bacterium]|nr:DUF58 domain-containing protein [Planctomycetota bacterium]